MFTRSSRYERVVRSQSCKKRKNCFKTLNTGMQRCRDHRCIYYRGGGGSPYNGLYREAPPERIRLSGLRYVKR